MFKLKAGILAVAALIGSAHGALLPRQANSSSTCNTACQERQLTALAWELEQRVSENSSFYDVPANYSAGLPPGTLLKVEPVTNLTNYAVPGPLSLSRIMYISSDYNGTAVPTSAYVLWPGTKAKFSTCDNSFPLVAWAHGTTGQTGACAPSNYKGLQYHFLVPFNLAIEGYAVVAPDYAGLGVSKLPKGEIIRHAWLNGPTQANDLANAIIAARAAFPEYLSPKGRFVAMGHSQGGACSWAFAEKQADAPLDGYRGTVTIAPPSRIIRQLFSDPSNVAALYAAPPFIAGISAAYPAYNYSGLTDLAADRWQTWIEKPQGCAPAAGRLFGDLTPFQIASPNWTQHPAVQEWDERTHLGGKKFRGPLLMIAGDADRVVGLQNPFGLGGAVNITCKLIEEGLDESLELSVYTGMDHFPVIQGSRAEWMKWIEERFSSQPRPGARCLRRTTASFRSEASFGPAFPNYSIESDGGDSWKGNL